MPTHHFQNEGPLVRIRGRDNSVDSFLNTVQSRVGANRHVGTAKIVIDRAHQADDVQVAEFCTLLGRYFACDNKHTVNQRREERSTHHQVNEPYQL